MWSGKKKKGSAEDFFKEEELDLELSGGRKKDKEKEDKDKRKKEKEDKKKTRDDEAKDSTGGGGGGGVGLFQRKHKKSVGSSDIDHLRKEKDKEKEKEKEREKEKEKEKSGRVFHRRNKSSSSTSGDPSAAAVVASAASRLNVLGGSNPDRDPTRLGIKRETFSPPGTLNLNSGLLSSYPPPTSSPRGANNSPRNPLGGTAAGTHSGPMAALPQLADVSHKRKNSVDEVSPRFEGSPMRGLADMKQPIPISELLKRSPITSPRSPVLGRELTEQQRQILAQAKKKLQLELVRDNLALVDRPMQPSSSSDDLKREILAVLDEWDDDREVDRERSLRDKQESEDWDRERRAKLTHLSRTSHPTSALGQYLLTRWKGQSPQQAQSSP